MHSISIHLLPFEAELAQTFAEESGVTVDGFVSALIREEAALRAIGIRGVSEVLHRIRADARRSTNLTPSSKTVKHSRRDKLERKR